MADLPFPKSLPDFQRLFPDAAACRATLGEWAGKDAGLQFNFRRENP